MCCVYAFLKNIASADRQQWIRHSSAVGVFKHLSVTAGLRIIHQPKLSSQQHPVSRVLWAVPSGQRHVGSVLEAASSGQHPVGRL